MRTYFKLLSVGTIIFLGLITWPWLILNTPLPQAVKQSLTTPWAYIFGGGLIALILTWRWYQANAEWVNHVVRGAMWILGSTALIAAVAYWWVWSKNQLPPVTPSREERITSALGLESAAAHRSLSAAIEDKILDYPERAKCASGLIIPPLKDALATNDQVAFESYLGQAVRANDLCREAGRSYADALAARKRERLQVNGQDFAALVFAGLLVIALPALAQNLILRRKQLLRYAWTIAYSSSAVCIALLVYFGWPVRNEMSSLAIVFAIGFASEFIAEALPLIARLPLGIISLITPNNESGTAIRITIGAFARSFIGQSLVLWGAWLLTYNMVLQAPELAMGTTLRILFLGILTYGAVMPLLRQLTSQWFHAGLAWVGGD